MVFIKKIFCLVFICMGLWGWPVFAEEAPVTATAMSVPHSQDQMSMATDSDSTTSTADSKTTFERRNALAVSQAAIGRQLQPFHFYDSRGKGVALEDYRGKPLVISLIYTSCYHICPTTTQNLNKVVRKAEAVLGEDNFNVLTIGFDTVRDNAAAMGYFARQQGVARDNWQFLAADKETIERLTEQLGFLYYPSPQGFDHLIQSTVIDKDGVVYRQVYGIEFDTPLLVEPLKELVFGEQEGQTLYHDISNKVRLFCTVYDPASDTYRFDYSIFVGLFVGLTIGFILVRLLIGEWRYSNAARKKKLAAESGVDD